MRKIVINNIKEAFKMCGILLNNGYACVLHSERKYTKNSNVFYTIFIIEYTNDDDPN